MTVHQHTCISVHCNACGETFDAFDEGSEAHFDTVADARTDSEHHGWFIANDGIALCGDDDGAHMAVGRQWIVAGELTDGELKELCRAYPALTPDSDGEIVGQAALDVAVAGAR